MAKTSSQPAIEWINLSKSYDGAVALRGVDLTVQAGEIFGFLGPNGSGKTTAIRCMLDLIRPTAGAIRVLSLDPQKDPVSVQRRCGYLPGELHFDDNLTPMAALRLFDSLRAHKTARKTDWKYVNNLVERLDVDTSKSIKNLSKGNKQKVGVIQAFMHQPELLLLDEPTSGLDPLMQQEVLKLVAESREAGATVFFSSHILSEVQAASDRVAVVRAGRIVEIASTRELLSRSLRRVQVTFAEPCLRETLQEVTGVEVLTNEENLRYRLQVQGDMDALVKTIAAYHVKEIESQHASLEDVFLAYYEADNE